MELDKKIRRFASAKISLAADSTGSVGSTGSTGSAGSTGSTGSVGSVDSVGSADSAGCVDSLVTAGVSLGVSLGGSLTSFFLLFVSTVSTVGYSDSLPSFFGSSVFPAGRAFLRTRLGFAGMALFRGVLHTTHRETLGGLILVQAGHAQPPTIAPLPAEAAPELGNAELELGNAELELGNAELVISTWEALVGFLENTQTRQCPQFLGKSGRFLDITWRVRVYALTAP